MRSFFDGFEKRASSEEGEYFPDWATRYVLPAVAAGSAAAAGAYALSRMGGKRVVAPIRYMDQKQAPRTWLGKAIDKVRFGADEVVEITKRVAEGDLPAHTLKGNEVAFVRQSPAYDLIKGDKSKIYGSTPKMTSLTVNKLKESKFVRSVTPKLHPKTDAYSVRGSQEDKLRQMEAIHKEWTRGGKGYFIKKMEGGQSGPGGDALLSNKDIERFLSGSLPERDMKYKEIARNILPDYGKEKLIIQRRMTPVADPITGKGIEFRIHTVGDKVLDTTLRTPVVPNPLEAHAATKVMREFVSALPEKMKKEKAIFAADVLKTDKGYRIVETNPGGASGYLDPNFMKKKGLLPHLKSIILNNRLYEELAGRKSPLMAAGRAVGVGTVAGAATAGGIYGYDKRDEISERFKPA